MEKDLDLHLVFEYKEGDVILGHRAPRSNRFYFVHDPNGASFKQMEAYHDQVRSFPDITRHMFGGYQLM
jgi:ADP-dependent phosphofructokinase/glucokinase